HGDVGTLSATVCVEFVQYQELQPFAVFNNLLVQFILPSHEQFQHHEIGQEDVWWVFLYPLSFLIGLLPRITGKSHRPVGTNELGQLIHLTIGQRIHRVNDYGAGSWCGIPSFGPQYSISYRDEKT